MPLNKLLLVFLKLYVTICNVFPNLYIWYNFLNDLILKILKNHPISYPIALALMVVLLILVKSDERFHTVSAVYICNAIGVPKAADDVKKMFAYNLDEIPFKD